MIEIILDSITVLSYAVAMYIAMLMCGIKQID